MSKSKDIVSVSSSLPNRIFIVPLMDKPIFPGIFIPVMIISPEDIRGIEEAIKSNSGIIGMILVREGSPNSPQNELFKVGTVAKIVKKIDLPDGGINVFVSTIRRFVIKRMISSSSPYSAVVAYPESILEADADEIKALTRSLIMEMKKVSENNPLFSEEVRLNMVNIDNPGKIADFITSILNIGRLHQQKILETFDVRARMEQVLLYIKKEQELLKIQRRIVNQINSRIEKSQREYFLREELKAIKKELGEPTDAKSKEYTRFSEKINSFKFEGEVKEKVEQELEKFALMDPSSSSEYIVTRNYLDTITNLPWGAPKEKKINMKRAEETLENDHYGLEDIKERILEYLAARKLRGDTKGSIICLVGPPGVGKTSIGESIARALGKPFFRFSVGGMRDEAEIKGHRRTYVGAMPGKIIQGLKIVKSIAPVFMIDEIDKMGISFQGDPSSALLEVLDPEQNPTFRDHYLDLPYDLSNVFFITTANTLDTIPAPLMDRMEIIRLSGYINEEKIEIAKRYLIPKSLTRHGLTKTQVVYNKTTLKMIADGYARDAGMRTYEKSLDKIHRKVARKITTRRGKTPYRISKENLVEYLDKPSFREEELKRPTEPGMAVGLAWTNYGGTVMLVEALAIPGKGEIELTGQMGDVMKESAHIAYTHIKSLVGEFSIPSSFFSDHKIHLHIPEGATPKDGPSAGITMASALLSLAVKKKVKTGIAMTGELSLLGKVMPIGGLREKIIAAKRNRIKTIIIPSQNEPDLDKVQDHVKKGLRFHLVSKLEEVLQILTL